MQRRRNNNNLIVVVGLVAWLSRFSPQLTRSELVVASTRPSRARFPFLRVPVPETSSSEDIQKETQSQEVHPPTVKFVERSREEEENEQ